MAFAATAADRAFHWLAEFHLDATVLRYADDDLSLIVSGGATGYYYEGRLVPGSSLVRDLGSFLENKEVVQTFDVVLDNRDQKVETLLDRHTFASRRVRVFLGEGQSKAHYSEVFTGNIVHPNGIQWDQDTISFVAVDQRMRTRRNVPPNKFTIDEYTNLETKAEGQTIPIIYGDYSSTAQGAVRVPCYCTNMAASQKTFKISNHGLQEIERVLKNAVVIAAGDILNTDLVNGSFALDSDVSYNSTTDIISANVKGLQTVNSTLIEKPMDVLRHFQTTWQGLTATDLNVTAYHTVNVSGTLTETVRRWIGGSERVSSEEILQSLLNEAVVDLRFVGGKYSPKYRLLDLDANRKTFREADLLMIDEATEKQDFRAELDPDRVFTNKVIASYNYDPINAEYLGSYTRQLTTSVTDVSAVIERSMLFDWYYDQTHVETRADRELSLYSEEPIMVELGLTTRGALLNLADQIDLHFSRFNGDTFQVRHMQTDPDGPTVRVRGFNVFMLGVGKWTNDTVTGWSASTLVQRRQQGFWMTDSGYAVTSTDSDTYNVSRWY